jgi:AcrR family transcriptional regulator
MPRVYASAKSKILDATERVILRDGPYGLSVDAVLLESGMSKGGFFHHFRSKEALLAALLERLATDVAEKAEASILSDPVEHARSLRAQVALAFDMPAAERRRIRALVLALLAAVMEAPSVAAQARASNEAALAKAKEEGADTGAALVVQLALDGFFLAESFGTLKLDSARRAAIRATLLGLVDRNKKEKRHA